MSAWTNRALVAALALTGGALVFAVLHERASPPRAAAGTTAPEQRPPAHAVVSASASALSAPVAATAPAASEPASAPAAAAAAPSVTHFRIGHRNVKAIHAEKDFVWLATTDGVIRYDVAADKPELFGRNEGLSSQNVLFVGRAGGRIVAGTASGELEAFDERTRRWSRHASAEALGIGAVLDLVETPGGDLWLAGLSGVRRVPPGMLEQGDRWQRYTAHSTGGGLPGEPVYALAQGSGGEMWFATEAGVARYHGGRWESWKFEPASTRVLAIEVDRRGTVWAGSWSAGLQRFDGKSWRAYSAREALPGAYVLALHADRQGKLWVGTDKGIVRIGGGKVEKKIAGGGLLSEKTQILALDPQGSLWAGGFGGVSRIELGTR